MTSSSRDEVKIVGEISLGYSALVLIIFIFSMLFILLMKVCYENHLRLKRVEVEKQKNSEARRFCDGQIIREKCLDLNLTADIEEAVLKTLHTNLIISLCSIKKESISIPEESVLSYVSRHGGMRESNFKCEFGLNQIPLPKVKVSEPPKRGDKECTESLKSSFSL